MKHSIRIGKVSSVDAAAGTIRAIIEDQQNIVTNNLRMMASEYNMPEVGDMVLCLFLGNGISHGFCLGRYFNDTDTPPVSDAKIWCKDFGDGTKIQYNKTTQELSITTEGDLKISVGGNLVIDVAGNITTTAPEGSISISAGLANTDISNTKTSPVTHHP
jgi:phage baseplate assembly protein V